MAHISDVKFHFMSRFRKLLTTRCIQKDLNGIWREFSVHFRREGETVISKEELKKRLQTERSIYVGSVFLVHLSRRLKCTIVIMRCPSSVRRPSVVRLSSLTFHIFDFSSETTEWILTKLYRKVDLNVLYQVCVFRAYRKNKMAALASDWLRHFRLLL